MTAPVYELGEAAYREFIRGADDRLEWHQLSEWVRARWARVELASRKAEARDREHNWEHIREKAERGELSPTQLFGGKR